MQLARCLLFLAVGVTRTASNSSSNPSEARPDQSVDNIISEIHVTTVVLENGIIGESISRPTYIYWPRDASSSATSSEPQNFTFLPHDLHDCITQPGCIRAFMRVQDCYGVNMGVQDPNEITPLGKKYQDCICDQDHRDEFNPLGDLRPCLICFYEANSTTVDKADLEPFHNLFVNFCQAETPSAYMFLRDVMAYIRKWHLFKDGLDATNDGFPYESALRSITSLEPKFTSRPEFNNPAFKATSSSNPPVKSKSTSLLPVPSSFASLISKNSALSRLSKLLTQTPPQWPYEKLVPVRAEGGKRTWTLTSGNMTGKAVATCSWFPKSGMLGREEKYGFLSPDSSISSGGIVPGWASINVSTTCTPGPITFSPGPPAAMSLVLPSLSKPEQQPSSPTSPATGSTASPLSKATNKPSFREPSSPTSRSPGSSASPLPKAGAEPSSQQSSSPSPSSLESSTFPSSTADSSVQHPGVFASRPVRY